MTQVMQMADIARRFSRTHAERFRMSSTIACAFPASALTRPMLVTYSVRRSGCPCSWDSTCLPPNLPSAGETATPTYALKSDGTTRGSAMNDEFAELDSGARRSARWVSERLAQCSLVG